MSKTQISTRTARYFFIYIFNFSTLPNSSFEANLINDIMAQSPTLVTFLFENEVQATEDPLQSCLSLYEFVGKKPEAIQEEHVEVIIII